MNHPLLTRIEFDALLVAANRAQPTIQCSLDLQRSAVDVSVTQDFWSYEGREYPHVSKAKERTIYYWSGSEFAPVARYSQALVKLVPTEWGAPTFEIDGVKMLPTASISPYADAQNKVNLIEPRGKVVLDTCAGLGYFAAWCLVNDVKRIVSFEKNPDVLWLRSLNPWSPGEDARLQLRQGDVSENIGAIESHSVDAILHDPPRFALAGELYSQAFYNELARVLCSGGILFHYVGTPNKLTTGRDVPSEVATRLRNAGFTTRFVGDGVLARKRR